MTDPNLLGLDPSSLGLDPSSLGFEPVKLRRQVDVSRVSLQESPEGPHEVGGAFRHGFQMLLVLGLGVVSKYSCPTPRDGVRQNVEVKSSQIKSIHKQQTSKRLFDLT